MRVRSVTEPPRSRHRACCTSIAKVLQQEGFIAGISEEGDGVARQLVLELKYSGKHRQPTIRSVQRVSKPGLRIYKNTRQLPKVLGGLRWPSSPPPKV